MISPNADRYKEVLEDCLREGYAPFKQYHGLEGRGSCVTAAFHRLSAELAIRNLPAFSTWVANQVKRKAEGQSNHCPDWNLYPPLAAKRGIEPEQATVMPGFEIKQITDVLDSEGVVVKQFVKTVPEAGEVYEPLPSHTIRGESAMVDQDGRVKQKWIKTKDGGQGPEAIEAIKATFNEWMGKSLPIPAPDLVNEELFTSYVLSDHHLGMFSWAKETGADYDLKIGEDILLAALADLTAQTPNSKIALLVSLGDFFHGDTSNNMTPRSHHVLDIDSRRPKVYQFGVRLMITAIQRLLEKHERVICRFLPGNHDPDSTAPLAIAMWAYFHNNERVDIDLSPSRFFFYEWGLTMIAGTHGDCAKIQEMPGVMAARQPDMWGRTRFRYAYGGHLHHKQGFNKFNHGAYCETFEILAPGDAYHASYAFGAGRSMQAITYSKTGGERYRCTSSIVFENKTVESRKLEA